MKDRKRSFRKLRAQAELGYEETIAQTPRHLTHIAANHEPDELDKLGRLRASPSKRSAIASPMRGET
jgi:hypothetical protein